MNNKEWYKKIQEQENYNTTAQDDFFEENKRIIITMAYTNWSPMGNGVVFLGSDGKLYGDCLTSGTSYGESSLIEIYRLDQNFIANGCWDDHNAILDDEEWEQLQKKYGDEASFINKKQVESIGVDYDERMIDYLVDG